MKIARVSEMREMDRIAIEKYGIQEELLMENAGHAAFSVLRDTKEIKGKKIIIFCGIGNNGGDGLVIARKIHSMGNYVKIFILGNPKNFKGASKMNYEITCRLPIEIIQAKTADLVKKDLVHCDVIVDAIFGTGLARNIEGLYEAVIKLINESNKTVLSVDIPSGVNGDTGQVMGIAIKAHYTVTFGLPKVGNMLYPGYDLGGRLFATHISFPPAIHESDSVKIEINNPVSLPLRNRDENKSSLGQVLFIAGASNYFGAPYFAAHAFLKAGGGFSRLAAPESITPVIAGKGSEIVFFPQKETRSGSISLENKTSLLSLAEKMDMIVIGPGISLDDETQKLVRELTAEINKPMIIDGDGITAICKDSGIVRNRQSMTILTPHPGEMSRLTGRSVQEITADRIAILKKTCADLNAIIVLKGAHSLTGFPDERIYINMSGNPGMATAGSGDVLAGTIAAMYGLGLNIYEAARQGVFIHGVSGDLAAEEKGEDGITAQDILDYLPKAVRNTREAAIDVKRYTIPVI